VGRGCAEPTNNLASRLLLYSSRRPFLFIRISSLYSCCMPPARRYAPELLRGCHFSSVVLSWPFASKVVGPTPFFLVFLFWLWPDKIRVAGPGPSHSPLSSGPRFYFPRCSGNFSRENPFFFLLACSGVLTLSHSSLLPTFPFSGTRGRFSTQSPAPGCPRPFFPFPVRFSKSESPLLPLSYSSENSILPPLRVLTCPFPFFQGDSRRLRCHTLILFFPLYEPYLPLFSLGVRFAVASFEVPGFVELDAVKRCSSSSIP